MLADSFGKNYAIALTIVATIVALAVALLAGFGPHAHGVKFTKEGALPSHRRCEIPGARS
jgi:hypothetical protein